MTDTPIPKANARSATEAIEGQPPPQAAATLRAMGAEQIRAALGAIPRDEAIEIAAHLPARDRAGAPPQTGEAAESAVAVEDAGTIDDLIVAAPAVLTSDQTAAEAVAFLVHHKSVADVSAIFVTRDERLVGGLEMRDILLARPGHTLAQIVADEPFTLKQGLSLKDAMTAAFSHQYNLYPVIDDDQRLLGVLPAWRLFERVAETFSGQAGAQVGLSREEQVGTGVLAAFRMRHPWLQVNLLTAFAAAFVVGLFEDTITRIVALAAFLPVLAGQSGNTGCQALAITLRGLTLGQLATVPVGRILRKEVLLGALNGAVVGVVAGAAMWLYATLSNEPAPLMLGLVILVAMTGACIGSGIFGVGALSRCICRIQNACALQAQGARPRHSGPYGKGAQRRDWSAQAFPRLNPFDGRGCPRPWTALQRLPRAGPWRRTAPCHARGQPR